MQYTKWHNYESIPLKVQCTLGHKEEQFEVSTASLGNKAEQSSCFIVNEEMSVQALGVHTISLG